MNLKAMLTLTACAMLLASAQAQNTNPSARRYVDFYEIDRASPATDPQTEIVKTQFRVLERAEAQADMGLSQEQITSLRKAYQAPSAQIPGLQEFIAQRRAPNKPDLTPEERASRNLETSRQMGRITARYQSQELQHILTLSQQARLRQIVLQVRGPVLLVLDTNLASEVGVDSHQMDEMREVVSKADREMIPLFQKFGRGFISGYSANETEQDRTREMNKLIPRLQQTVRQRDDGILRILTAQQAEHFRNLQGKSLSIQWDAGEFMRLPFEKKDS